MMDQDTLGKLLPNLEITLGNDSGSEILSEEGELSDSYDDELAYMGSNKKEAEVYRQWVSTLQEVKLYENKAGPFVTGVDLASEALIKKLQERAERFGIERRHGPVTQMKIDDLYKSLGVKLGNLTHSKLKNIRLEALHMRGVEEMSTTDIFNYFEDFCPASVEWINDYSCNVIWLDATSAARAIIGMSRPLNIKRKDSGTASKEITSRIIKEPVTKGFKVLSSPEIEYIVEVSDIEDDPGDKKESDETVANSMEVDPPPDTEKPGKSETKNDSSDALNVPVPPGYWRIGIRHPKSKAILLRFATKDDRKYPGAEKRSNYYQKYGNPNYGGLKGLISSSRKRKMQAAKNRQVVEKLTEASTSQSETNSGETKKRTVAKSSRAKMPRMRMYADDEEAKKKKGYPVRYEAERKSVHSRLGTKYTKDDLSQLGNKFSSESEEEEEDDISIHCTVPDRYNVWSDIAEEDRRQDIAEEGRRRPRRNSPDTESFGHRKSRNQGAKGGRSFARDRSSPESAGSSRPWRRPRDDSTEDLRRELRSRMRSILNEPEEDLRSKIKRNKKDAANKHRSPMFMDD